MHVVPLVAAVAVVMLVLERLAPGRRWPRVRGWWSRALLLNGVQIASVYVGGVAWDGWMLRQRIWRLDEVHPWLGALFGYLVITFIYYWWHRARHASAWLWRAFHQVHHSPQRLEVITAFYKHPAEIFVNALLSSMILYWLCGLDVHAATLAVTFTGLAELVYHWNVPTPYALGFVFQRPESHCVHHQEGHHAQNYGDLPLWDMLFGTFHNPKAWDDRCGFGNAEARLGEMLMGVDVNIPPQEGRSQEGQPPPQAATPRE